MPTTTPPTWRSAASYRDFSAIAAAPPQPGGQPATASLGAELLGPLLSERFDQGVHVVLLSVEVIDIEATAENPAPHQPFAPISEA